MAADDPTILVVDDEEDVTDLYTTWLENDYDVRSAYEGESALELLDDDVDVVLLDRRMPGLSGDEVLTEIRDQDLSTRVVMVTAVKPDFDILDMGFDDYLVKPVLKDDLHQVVEGMLTRVDYDGQLQEYFALVSKKAVLEAEKDAEELSQSEEYQALIEDVHQLRQQVDHARASLSDHEDFVGAFRDLE
ncbi:DNA-binding protein [halophilic archaeon]|nr:DNA-binding protein [halophilic archaeon]